MGESGREHPFLSLAAGLARDLWDISPSFGAVCASPPHVGQEFVVRLLALMRRLPIRVEEGQGQRLQRGGLRVAHPFLQEGGRYSWPWSYAPRGDQSGSGGR